MTKYRYVGRDGHFPLDLPSGPVWVVSGDMLEMSDADLEWVKRKGLESDFRKPFKGIPDYGTRLSNAPDVEFQIPVPEPKKPKRKYRRRKTNLSKDGE